MQEKRNLPALVSEIRGCQICAREMPHGVRPVLRMSRTARLCIAGPAPGQRVHDSGIPYDDASGKRLRAWLGMEPEIFYDESRVAIVPMGFCFPGYDEAGADNTPRPERPQPFTEQGIPRPAQTPLFLAL